MAPSYQLQFLSFLIFVIARGNYSGNMSEKVTIYAHKYLDKTKVWMPTTVILAPTVSLISMQLCGADINKTFNYISRLLPYIFIIFNCTNT